MPLQRALPPDNPQRGKQQLMDFATCCWWPLCAASSKGDLCKSAERKPNLIHSTKPIRASFPLF